MGYYIDPQGNYYEGDRISALDIEVSQRPDPTYDWNNNIWVKNTNKDKEANNKLILDQILVLESKQNRYIREIALGKGDVVTDGLTPKQRLEALDDQIVELRSRFI